MLGFEPDLSVANPARSSPRKVLAGKGKGTVGRTDGRTRTERTSPPGDLALTPVTAPQDWRGGGSGSVEGLQ